MILYPTSFTAKGGVFCYYSKLSGMIAQILLHVFPQKVLIKVDFHNKNDAEIRILPPATPEFLDLNWC